MRRRRYLAGLTTAAVVAAAGCGGGGGGETTTETIDLPFEREVDPSRTYLRTNNDDAGDARPVDIASLGIDPGLSLRLVRQGQFTGSSGGRGMTGVFSSSATLEPSDTRRRVADAVDAGEDYETSATFEGDRPTDIPQDFLIADNQGDQTSVIVTVPEGATHLFVAAIDNFYEDNGQGETPFGLRIERA